MSNVGTLKTLWLAAPLALLTACGGAEGGGIALTPAPAPAATPAPPPPPPPPILQPGAVALQSDVPFVTLGVAETDVLSPSHDSNSVGWKDTGNITASQPSRQSESVDFRFDRLTGQYAITFPDGNSGQLVLSGLGGSAGRVATTTFHTVAGINGDLGVSLQMPVPSREGFKYTYSHFGEWTKAVANADGSAIETYGVFVYGIETLAAAVPRTGTARYLAEIVATSPMDAWAVDGRAELVFNFGAGTLGGYIHPTFTTNGWYTYMDYDYGRYDFTQTVYATGSTRYSGAFAKDGVGLPNSWFDGSLTGPSAQEVIGRFSVPFTRDGTNGAITGIWIGKRN